MIYSLICIISASNIFILSLILILFITKPPTWLIRSNFQLLAHIQYFIFLSTASLLLSLYEAQESSISRNGTRYSAVLFKEIPKSITVITLILTLVTIYMHTIRQFWLDSKNVEKIEKLEALILKFAVCLVSLLNFFSFYLGIWFAFIASSPLLLVPVSIGKDGYWVTQISTNENKYWKNNIVLQGIIAFRYIILVSVLVRLIQDYVKWPLFDLFSTFFNSNIVWDVMFMWMDFESVYPYDYNTHIIEVLAFIMMAVVSIASFIGSKLINKHLAPFTLIVAIFCSSGSLRIFALTLAVRLTFVLELYT